MDHNSAFTAPAYFFKIVVYLRSGVSVGVTEDIHGYSPLVKIIYVLNYLINLKLKV